MLKPFENSRIGLAGLVIGALLMGWALRGENQAAAEVRRTTPAQPEQHFKSGGRMSEAVLQEILVVLKRMDDRLARIELAVPGGSRPGTLQAMPAADGGPSKASDNQVPELKVRRSK